MMTSSMVGAVFSKKNSPKYPKVNSSESNKISGISDQKKLSQTTEGRGIHQTPPPS